MSQTLFINRSHVHVSHVLYSSRAFSAYKYYFDFNNRTSFP